MRSRFENERRRVIDYLRRIGIIRSDKVYRALLSVPREEFVPPQYREYAYIDEPLPIGFGQTISAIHMVAIMTEELDPEPGNIVLEIGTGSGYQAAVLAEIVAKQDPNRRGHVYTVERIPELAEFAKKNLERTGYIEYVTVIVGDGTKGYPEKAPYDRIIVTAAAPEVPKPLLKQLRVGGKLVIPVGDRFVQRLLTVKRVGEHEYVTKHGIECMFVPLIGEYGWKD